MVLGSLLNGVKTTVEELLSVPTSNVWSVYGGLKRLSQSVETILNHQLKYSQTTNQKSALDYNQFIKSLHWLNPTLVPSAEKIRKVAQAESISEGQAWIRQSLQSHTMSAMLRTLVQNTQYLHTCYYEDAFLCQPAYFDALCICLEAVEQNSPTHLTNINPSLLRNADEAENVLLTGTTASSIDENDPLTESIVATSVELNRKEAISQSATPSKGLGRQRVTSLESLKLDSILNEESENNTKNLLSPRHDKGKQPMKRSGHHRSHSDMSFLKGAVSGELPHSHLMSTSMPDDARLEESRLSDISAADYGESLFRQPGEGYFPQPRHGESLKSFLSSQDFDTCAELDKENAHFAISEALIAAIEQMKWNQVLRPINDKLMSVSHEDSDLESDEEILRLKQKIQERRRLKLKRRIVVSDTRSSSGATPKSSSHSGSLRDSDSLFSEEEDIRNSFSDTDSMLTLRDGLTISDRLSLDSGGGSTILSAEQVALSLLSQFNEYHLPKADELVWLVSEKDAPQALLPLPDSLPISPDDIIEGRKFTRIRGNTEWAPPRAQIIFNIQRQPRRKDQVLRQNYRCAGCGMKTEEAYIKRFRYCDYLGKFFCNCCHTNKMAIIPARVIHSWDFNQYYVSNFAYDLLERLSGEAVYNIKDINPQLLERSKTLQRITVSRIKLKYVKTFLMQCRLGVEAYDRLQEIPSYLMDDIHTYSLNDLVRAKSRELDEQLQSLVKEAIHHVMICPLCRAKGFICEYCKTERDVIFPFQLEKVARCSVCQSCYHTGCFNKNRKACPKCARIEYR